MGRRVVVYLDKEGKKTTKDKAYEYWGVEYDDEGRPVREIFGLVRRDKED